MHKRITRKFHFIMSILVLLGGMITGLYYVAYKYAIINSDAGFYLPLAQEISKGLIPYKDLAMWHTPLGMNILACIPYFLRDWAVYEHYLLLIFFFHLLNTYLLFSIGRLISDKKIICFWAASLYLILVFIHEGIYILLEPFSVFFILLSSIFCLKAETKNSYYAVSGIMASLAFLTKQYSLAILLPLLFAVVTSGRIHSKNYVKNIVSRGLILFTGYLIPIIICVCWFSFYAEYPFERLIEQWIYSTEGMEYGERLWYKSIYSLMVFTILYAPFLMILPILYVHTHIPRRGHILLLYFVSCALPLYFQQFPHYFQLIIPFAIILGIFLFDQSYSIPSMKNSVIILCSISLILSTYRGVRTGWKIMQAPLARERQKEIAREINVIIPPNSLAYIAHPDYQMMNYLCRFQSPDLQNIGYHHPYTILRHQLTSILKNGYTIIGGKHEYLQQLDFSDELKKYHFLVRKELSNNIIIYKKN